MPDILEIAYLMMVGWALPLRAAIQANPALAVIDAIAWGQGPLSDYAFAASTRLSYLPDIIRGIDENLAVLGEELVGRDSEIDALVREGRGYTFKDYAAVRRLLVGVSSFITEARSCFENLARFYRRFLNEYFDEQVSEKASYAAVGQMAPPAGWAENLQRIRHDLLHERSLWLAFEIRPSQKPRYDPLFLLNWRPGMFQPDDTVSIQTLREIRVGLDGAVRELIATLTRRVQPA